MASTADLEAEILAEMEENPEAYEDIAPVNDTITIDPETKMIHLPASETLFGVEEEKDVERKYFRCPRIVGDNIDLAEHQIYISYVTAKDKNGTFMPGIRPALYYCDDMKLDETGNYIEFSWLLSGNVLENPGFVAFAVIAKCMDGETLKTRWKTTPAIGTVLMTVPDSGQAVAELYPDAIAQIFAKLDEIEQGSVSKEVIAEAVADYMEANPIEETDPTVPEWAKQSEKPSYTASEVGADKSGTAESKVSEHNVATDAHNDIRLAIQGLTNKLNALADSDDTSLDQLSEIVVYIKSNKTLIDAITTSKVSVSDIIDNLTTNASNKPLSAAKGVALKTMIDAIVVPTKLSELENDSGYAKTTDIPDKLPNPQKITFAGAVSATYDGSEPLTVEIPSGGDGSTGQDITITTIASGTIPSGTEKVFTHTGITFGQLNDYKRIAITIMSGNTISGSDWAITYNEDSTNWKMIQLTSQRGYIELRKVVSHIWDVLFKTSTNSSSGFSSSPYAPYLTVNAGYVAGTYMLDFTSTKNSEICIYNQSTTTADVNWKIQGMNF